MGSGEAPRGRASRLEIDSSWRRLRGLRESGRVAVGILERAWGAQGDGLVSMKKGVWRYMKRWPLTVRMFSTNSRSAEVSPSESSGGSDLVRSMGSFLLILTTSLC